MRSQMTNWFFMHTEPDYKTVWKTVYQNMNICMGGLSEEDYDYVLPVNSKLIPRKYIDQFYDEYGHIFNILNGQVIDQFDKEEFKYVLAHNKSDYNKDDELVLKVNLFPDILLNETNCKTINLSTVKETLEEYEWVAVGHVFSNVNHFNANEPVARANYYVRDTETLKLKLIGAENHPEEHTNISAITFAVFKKTKGEDTYIGFVNPNLVKYHNLLEGSVGDNDIRVLDSTLEDTILKPEISGGVIVGDSIYSEDKIVFEFERNGIGAIDFRVGDKGLQFPLDLKTNMEHEWDDNALTIFINRDYGYVKFLFDVDSMINDYSSMSMGGKHELSYKIFRG